MMSSEDLASGKRQRGTLQVSGIVYAKTLCGAERAVQLKARMVRIRRPSEGVGARCCKALEFLVRSLILF